MTKLDRNALRSKPHLVTITGGASANATTPPATRFGEAIGQSAVMRALFAKLERASMTAETILLLGESGTGKEVLARAIHAASPRRCDPCVVLDCSAVTPTLLEAELFGHARGAYTGAVTTRDGLLEEAGAGTLFIDEIGEMPLDLQPRLLRAIEARESRRLGSGERRPFRGRIIAATHRDLKARVKAGLFREDLYYRLAVVEVQVPALRARKEDIPLLIKHFLDMQPPSRRLASLPPRVMSELLAHDWPGNVRELRNIVTRLTLFSDVMDEVLREMAFRAAAPSAVEAPRSPEPKGSLDALLKLSLREMRDVAVEQVEARYLAGKLREHEYNISRVADDIGASRQLVYRLLERHGLRDRIEEASSAAPRRPPPAK